MIAASLLTLHNPVTPANVFGMFLAVAGVFCYNRVCFLMKYLGSQAKQREHELAHQALPLSRTHTTLSDASLIAMDPVEQNDTLYWSVTLCSLSLLQGLEGELGERREQTSGAVDRRRDASIADT